MLDRICSFATCTELACLRTSLSRGELQFEKYFAGGSGRFSTDLDFAVRNIGDDASAVLDMLAEAIDGLEIGPFVFGTEIRRGRRHLTFNVAEFGGVGQLSSKLDIAAPPWLDPKPQGWVPLPIHTQYGGPLPSVPVVRLEENMAEKIARLNRTTTARDVYDLVWIMRKWRSHHRAQLDFNLVRRLAVMKIWTDMHGISTNGASWKSPFQSGPFDLDRWLRPRHAREFDDENIGLLAVPPPSLDELGEHLANDYRFLADLDAREREIARCHGADRNIVLEMVSELPGRRLPHGTCW
jgi:predicted nucleotidyltransferase component of viral defense system